MAHTHPQTCACDNCDWRGTLNELGAELEEIKNLAERLSPGGEVPAGECPCCGCLAYIEAQHKFTVLLQRPDYIGEETFLVHTEAANPAEALSRAQAEAAEADDCHPDDAGDYAPLFICLDHHNDLCGRI